MTSLIPDVLADALVVRPYVLRRWTGAAVADSVLMGGSLLEGSFAAAIWLRYVRAGGALMLGTESVEARGYLEPVPRQPAELEAEIKRLSARWVVHHVVDYTLPLDRSTGEWGARPAPGLIEAISAYGDECADTWREWPTITWQIDGAPVTARRLDFAGAWAAFAIVGAATVFAYAPTGEPDDLDLVSWPSGPAAPGSLVPVEERQMFSLAEYHAIGIDLHYLPGPVLPRPNVDRYHPDQLRLLPRGPI